MSLSLIIIAFLLLCNIILATLTRLFFNLWQKRRKESRESQIIITRGEQEDLKRQLEERSHPGGIVLALVFLGIVLFLIILSALPNQEHTILPKSSNLSFPPSAPLVATDPPAAEEFHTVQPSEYLLGICRKYDCTLDEILRLNPHLATRKNSIYPGEKIRLRSPAAVLASEEGQKGDSTLPEKAEKVSAPARNSR